MRVFGIIGFPLSHSFSKPYFHNKFIKESITDADYQVFPIESIDDITTVINNNPELMGFSVTIPYKKAIIPFLNAIDETALKIGAVNCVKVIRTYGSYTLKGYNTDHIGFQQSLVPLLKPYHTKALILGTGGASKAVAYVLNKLSIQFQYVSRTKSIDTLTYDELDTISINDNLLIVNTTPVGMYPKTDVFPLIPYQSITENHLLYDLIYNPAETQFLKLGKAKIATTINGEKMLHLQAEEAWKIWND